MRDCCGVETDRYGARLQAGKQEDRAGNHRVDDVPEEQGLQTSVGADEGNARPAHVQAGHHCGEYAGSAQRVREPERQKRRHEGQQDFDARFRCEVPQAQRHVPDQQPPSALAYQD